MTFTNTQVEVTIPVQKIWDDANDQDRVRPADVTVNLLANGKETGKKVTLNKDNNWTYTWTELEKK